MIMLSQVDVEGLTKFVEDIQLIDTLNLEGVDNVSYCTEVTPDDSVSQIESSEVTESVATTDTMSTAPEKLIKRGIVYKMTSSNGLIYIGSTSQTLSRRLSEHKYNAKINRSFSSKLLFNEDANVTIIALETTDNISKFELQLKERYWILKTKEDYSDKLVNYNIPSEFDYNNNKGLYIQQSNAKRNAVKIQCCCGGKYSYQNKSNHNKTKKHQAYIKTLTPIIINYNITVNGDYATINTAAQ